MSSIRSCSAISVTGHSMDLRCLLAAIPSHPSPDAHRPCFSFLCLCSQSYLQAASEVPVGHSLDPSVNYNSPKFRSRNQSYMRAVSTLSQASCVSQVGPLLGFSMEGAVSRTVLEEQAPMVGHFQSIHGQHPPARSSQPFLLI